jgi:hypothetical protein
MGQVPTVEPPPPRTPFAGSGSPTERPPRRTATVLAVLAILAVLVVGVIAVAVSAGGEGDQDDVGPAGFANGSSDPSPEVVVPPPPGTHKAKTSPSEVLLTWSGPAPDDPLDRYEIRRDDVFLGYVSPPLRRFTDRDAIPGERHLYAVRVETPEGAYSEAAKIRVRTPIPPLKDASLQGTFDVRTTFLSKTGYGDYAAPTFGWKLSPTCGSGPCSAKVRDNGWDELRFTLVRDGRTYEASYTGRAHLECLDTPTTTTISIAVHVAKASVIDGEWRATKLTGTFRHSEAAQLGCRSSSATLSMNATLVR